MSLFELGRATGRVSPEANPRRGSPCQAWFRTCPFAIWPRWFASVAGPVTFDASPMQGALLANRDYLDEIRRVDIRRVDGIGRDPGEGWPVPPGAGAKHGYLRVPGDHGEGRRAVRTIHSRKETARSYLAALERLMVVEQQPPWAPHLRSRSRLRHAPKPTLHGSFARDCGAECRTRQPHEGHPVVRFSVRVPWSVRDLRVYAQAMGGRVYHYRDNTGLEVDAIVDAGPDRWAAFEVKLGQGRVDEAAAALLRFAEPGGHGPQRSAGSARRHHRQRVRIPAARWRGRDPGGGAGAVRGRTWN